MQFALMLGSIALFSVAQAEYCYNQVQTSCSGKGDDDVKGKGLFPCSSQFSGVHHVMGDFEVLVRKHLSHSFQYLLMSANFGNYVNQREGLSKLFRKLSDRTWDDAIDTIKFMAKRGSAMRFGQLAIKESNPAFDSGRKDRFDMHELESLSRALDMSKHLAEDVHKIHAGVTKSSKGYHDTDAINFLEDKFVEKHTKSIRDLSGHINDLYHLIKNSKPDPSLSIFLFDEYLKTLY